MSHPPFSSRLKTIIGVLTTICTLVGSVCQLIQHRKDRPALLRMQIVDKKSIYDNSSYSNGKLKVFLDTIEIYTFDKKLTELTLEISNVRERVLKDTDYLKIPFGITINNGIFIEKPVIAHSTSDYLFKEFAAFYSNETERLTTTLNLPKLVLNKRDNCTIRFYILSDNDDYELNVFGGLYEQSHIKLEYNEEKGLILQKAIHGDLWIQLIRAVFYGVIAYFIFCMLYVLYSVLKYFYLLLQGLKSLAKSTNGIGE